MMRCSLDHIREVETPFGEEFLVEIMESTLKKVPFVAREEGVVQVGVAAVGEEKIQALNKEYRGKDAVTDILSFGAEENWLKKGSLPAEKEFFLGDLVYNPAFILRAAKEDGITDEHEMSYMFSHGILHLLGYDHSDEMFAIQDKVTQEYIETHKIYGTL
jgi:probable rRNA maturation factor